VEWASAASVWLGGASSVGWITRGVGKCGFGHEGDDARRRRRIRRAACAGGIDSEIRPLVGGQHSLVAAGGRVPEINEAIGETGRWLRAKLGVKQPMALSSR
jgi:hypothetical protein